MKTEEQKANECIVKERKFSVTEKQYLSAQKKAFRIWKKLLSKEPEWAFNYVMNKNNYVALAENPQPCFYTVCHEQTKINTATGMFRFPNEKVADQFIKMMGTSIKHLFPKIHC